ncbi:MAG: helix-turn-helix transcriptional regulator, partial [Thermoanaerobaculia bacterium]|nr:helix-turn-helix transcriptional regulator [Thermoanaerobaculia bacterium]
PVLPPGEAPAGAEDPVERLRTGLMPRLREDLTADDLASIAGVSLRTLQRLFRERFDTSPMTWLMDARLSEAARLIRAGDDPVTKIAYRVGFKDPSHFTRRFKGRFGVSPNEYRRADTPPAPIPAANRGEES